VFVLIIMNDEEIMALKRPIIDTCIKSTKRYGWSDATGFLRGLLFLESEPMSFDMLAEKSGYSKTTVRLSMNFLERLGLVTRVVDPLRKHHHSKQHRYALETDPEAMKRVILSFSRNDVHSMLEALNQVEKNLDAHDADDEKIMELLNKTKYFYEEMQKVLDLMNQYTLKELINILEKHNDI